MYEDLLSLFYTKCQLVREAPAANDYEKLEAICNSNKTFRNIGTRFWSACEAL
jgi:hypothetical protein